MRAMVVARQGDIASRPLELRDAPPPEPAPGQVLVRVRVNGICRTDLHVVEGDLGPVRAGLIPGHQVVGIVERAGAGVRSPVPGDRVGIAWVNATCGACAYCAEGAENLCADPRFTGLHADGGYAELAVAPAAWTHRIPEGFSDEDAAPLLCAGVIGYRALRLSGARPGQRLGLFGFGNSAHVTIQVARHEGCEVFVSSLEPGHRALARELGATWTGGPGEAPPEPLHAAILFAPAGELVPFALRALRRGGTLAVAGIHVPDIPALDYERDLFHERVLRSVTAFTRQDARELLDLAPRIPIRTRTVAYPLEQANEALADLKAGRVRGAAVLRVAVGPVRPMPSGSSSRRT